MAARHVEEVGCETCDGEGKVAGPDSTEVDCTDCSGSGVTEVECEVCEGTWIAPCGTCGGAGDCDDGWKCRGCRGSGEVRCGESEDWYDPREDAADDVGAWD